jgi:hypothetical protein
MKGERLQMQQIARKWTGAALRVLHRGLRSADERVRIMAAKELLDRGWGRPAQALTGPDGGPLGLMVGMMPSAPITDAATAAATYLQIMRGDPNADLSGITFAPPIPAEPTVDEPPLPSMEAMQEPFEAEVLSPYQPPAAPALESEAAPDESNVVDLWSRLGK